MQRPLAKTYIALVIAVAAIVPGQSHSWDNELSAHFQEAFSTEFCVSEVLEKAQAEFAKCKDAWKAPIEICAAETGLYEFVTSSELSEEEWAARYEAKAHQVTVCLIAALRKSAKDQSNPDRAIYRAIIEYDDILRELDGL
jgi:hypothetical protein